MKRSFSLLLASLLCLGESSPSWSATMRPVPRLSTTQALGTTVPVPLLPAASNPLPGPVSLAPALASRSTGLPLPLEIALVPASAAALAESVQRELAEGPLKNLGSLGPEDSRRAGERVLEGGAGAAPALAGFQGGQVPTGNAGALAPPSGAPPAYSMRHYRLARRAFLPFFNRFYRVEVRGLEKLPAGPAIVIANHVSYLDPILISYAANRPMRFLMYRRIYKKAPRFFKSLGAIPISSQDSREKVDEALALASQAIKNGETVVIFPEGARTYNGNLAGFRHGFERLARETGVPVVPAYVDGVWGSVFSRAPASSPHAGRRPVTVRLGAPLKTEDSGAVGLAQAARDAVQLLGAEAMESRVRETAKPLPLEFLSAAKKFWGRKAVAGSTGKTLKYGELLTGSVLLSSLLKPRLQGANVGVLLPPSTGGALANIALGALGKVPVNLNYTAGPQAMDHAMAKAGITTVVTSRKFIAALKDKGAALPAGEMVYLEDLMPLVPKWKKILTHLALRILPRALIERLFFSGAARSLDEDATILFTSGSSSLPKGVELTHLNIRSNIEMVRQVVALGAKDAVLGILPFFHSFGYTVTLWLPLLSGITAIYHTHPLETAAIAKLAQEHRPTILLGTPTFLQRYSAKIPAEAFSKLRLVIAGAEKLRGQIAEEFEKKFGTRPLEGYGATETSPIASVNLPDHEKQVGTKPGSVGHPMPGTVARVVDAETGLVLPYGQRGMLLIKGPHVMKGYLGEPRKTAEALRDGWYVTGDLAVMDRDGFVTLAGRLSRFSKIAGEMVSHVALEEKLHEAARTTELLFAVTAVPDPARGERLVVLHAGYDGEISELLTKLKALGLPNISIPSRESFYKVDAIPVLGTGKLDLKALNEKALELTR